MSDEVTELSEQLAKWTEERAHETYEKLNLQNPYALVDWQWEVLMEAYVMKPVEELREMYRIEIYKRVVRKEKSK